jgi:hypothetical protein
MSHAELANCSLNLKTLWPFNINLKLPGYLMDIQYFYVNKLTGLNKSIKGVGDK